MQEAGSIGKHRFYSLIIPVFNRPEEIETVLSCLVKQTYTEFEIIIVESGSTDTSESVVKSYKDRLDANWFMYKNDGQGFSRNYGMTKAKGDYFVILDSDIILDENYLENLNNGLNKKYVDAFGGPDRYHDSFTATQKAVDHVMTAFLTTGGIRGGKTQVGKFYPRSFNMGFSRCVYKDTKGYKWPFFGEDIELSRRIMALGYKTGLIPEAFVYHKRKPSLIGHWKQMHFFGKARINIYKEFPDTLKATHFFPAVFTLGLLLVFLIAGSDIALNITNSGPSWLQILFYTVYAILPSYLLLISFSGILKYKSLLVGLIAIPATFTQMVGYGTGFIKDFLKRVIFSRDYNFINKD
jgi:glycosyltransferase involved in cell wall biosynthesis